MEKETEQSEGQEGLQLRMRALEEPTRLSRSVIWELQRRFYSSKGADAWGCHIVPSFITTNNFIARQYAELVLAFVKDHIIHQLRSGERKQPEHPSTDSLNQLDITTPVYIIELGSGPGKFGFLFLRWLRELQQKSSLPFPPFKYVMTDFTASNIEFWRSHEDLACFVSEGLLDFALLDADMFSSGSGPFCLKLVCSGTTLTPENLSNPLIVLANYVFDTIRHEAFQVSVEGLSEGLLRPDVTAPAPANKNEPLDPALLEQMRPRWVYKLLEKGAELKYFEQAAANNVLSWYKTNLLRLLQQETGLQGELTTVASFLLPVGAFRLLARLKKLARGGLFVISGDKGVVHPREFLKSKDPRIAVHGSFSISVNYHALSLFAPCIGVAPLTTSLREGGINIGCFVSLPRSHTASDAKGVLTHLEETSRSFAHLDRFGPGDWFNLQKFTMEDLGTAHPRANVMQSEGRGANLSLEHAIALVKLSADDTDLWFKFRRPFLNDTAEATPALRADAILTVERAWANHFFLHSEKDIAFEIGLFFFNLGRLDLTYMARALHFYEESERLHGVSHLTSHNIGLCNLRLGNSDVAEAKFEQSLKLQPAFVQSQRWLEHIRQMKAPQQADVSHLIGSFLTM